MFCKHCGKKIKEGDKFCNFCGQVLLPEVLVVQKKSWGSYAWKVLLIVAVIIFVSLYLLVYYIDDYIPEDYHIPSLLDALDPSIQPIGYFSEPSLYNSTDISDDEWFSYINYTKPYTSQLVNSTISNTDIYRTVVKIVCEDKYSFYYGSGTNMFGGGYIVTNLHVIESNSDLECMIGFPDPESGLISEAYWATPIINTKNDTGHDLALLSIEDPVFDEEYNIYGYYEKVINSSFPYYEETEECLEKSPQLGEGVLVLGYPVLSGGALTVTDGLISSLYSMDGYIITSAKIGGGNSGGLAIDSDFCFVGVPTAVYYDSGENYGEIIDAFFVYEFLEAVLDDLEEYYNRFE